MSFVPSLLQAIVRLDGEALVMHAGDKPYVVSPTGQVDLANRGLTLEAVNGVVNQLSADRPPGRRSRNSARCSTSCRRCRSFPASTSPSWLRVAATISGPKSAAAACRTTTVVPEEFFSGRRLSAPPAVHAPAPPAMLRSPLRRRRRSHRTSHRRRRRRLSWQVTPLPPVARAGAGATRSRKRAEQFWTTTRTFRNRGAAVAEERSKDENEERQEIRNRSRRETWRSIVDDDAEGRVRRPPPSSARPRPIEQPTVEPRCRHWSPSDADDRRQRPRPAATRIAKSAGRRADARSRWPWRRRSKTEEPPVVYAPAAYCRRQPVVEPEARKSWPWRLPVEAAQNRRPCYAPGPRWPQRQSEAPRPEARGWLRRRSRPRNRSVVHAARRACRRAAGRGVDARGRRGRAASRDRRTAGRLRARRDLFDSSVVRADARGRRVAPPVEVEEPPVVHEPAAVVASVGRAEVVAVAPPAEVEPPVVTAARCRRRKVRRSRPHRQSRSRTAVRHEPAAIVELPVAEPMPDAVRSRRQSKSRNRRSSERAATAEVEAEEPLCP